jgi:hypothetical protein
MAGSISKHCSIVIRNNDKQSATPIKPKRQKSPRICEREARKNNEKNEWKWWRERRQLLAA